MTKIIIYTVLITVLLGLPLIYAQLGIHGERVEGDRMVLNNFFISKAHAENTDRIMNFTWYAEEDERWTAIQFGLEGTVS